MGDDPKFLTFAGRVLENLRGIKNKVKKKDGSFSKFENIPQFVRPPRRTFPNEGSENEIQSSPAGPGCTR
jgi:hypothetical protein